MAKIWADEDERKRFFAKLMRPKVFMNRDMPVKSGGWPTAEDAILTRHGVKPDANILMPHEAKDNPIVDYALISGHTFDGFEVGELCVDVLGYYSIPDLFLVKYKQDNRYPEYFEAE